MSISHWSFVAVAIVAASGGFALHAAMAPEPEAQASTRVYELRTYNVVPGKMQALEARFRDHTLRFFPKYGLQVVGSYYIPIEGEATNNAIIYVLAHESREAADRNWAAFQADPEWRKARAASVVDGELTTSVTRQWLRAADWSPVK